MTCDRAVFMRQRFCDEIRRTSFSTTKPVASHTTAADVRPAAWLQLAPAKSPVATATQGATAVEESPFLSNSSSSSRASSFSSSRSEAGL